MATARTEAGGRREALAWMVATAEAAAAATVTAVRIDLRQPVALAVLDRSGGICEFPGCPNTVEDTWHRQSGWQDATTVLAVCRGDGQWLQANLAEAADLGWIVAGGDAAGTPVRTGEGWVLLAVDGTTAPCPPEVRAGQ